MITLTKIISKSILLATILFALSNVEIGSKLQVLTSIEDQEELQLSADSLSTFILIGIIWTIGSSLLMYSYYQIQGFLVCFVINLIFLGYIYNSFIKIFRKISKSNNLEFPNIFKNFI